MGQGVAVAVAVDPQEEVWAAWRVREHGRTMDLPGVGVALWAKVAVAEKAKAEGAATDMTTEAQ